MFITSKSSHFIARLMIFYSLALSPFGAPRMFGGAAEPTSGSSTFLPKTAAAAVIAGLGPSYEDLHRDHSLADDRPDTYQPTSKVCTDSYANRINPFELGAEICTPDSDYWSVSGQVAYIPDDTRDPGLDRIQTFAYYNHVFAISPRLDNASGTPHPDPQSLEQNYTALLGHAPKQPIAVVRNSGLLQNEALVIWDGGLLACAGTQTSRGAHDLPYPGLLLPKNKRATGLAVSTSNEIAVITVWDTDTNLGQLAVVALEGKYIQSHTLAFMGAPNQGSWSDFKLLGYIDLPMSHPSSVAMATNALWNGPSDTSNKDLGQINLANEADRTALHHGYWQGVFASAGYAIVASRSENKIVFVDFAPLMTYLRESYLSSAASFDTAVKSRGNKPAEFPLDLEHLSATSRPRVTQSFTVSQPTAVLAGMRVGRWGDQPFKAYVSSAEGKVHIFDTSSFMAKAGWQKKGPLGELDSVSVGQNPVAMCFTRWSDSTLPPNAEPLNDTVYVACRGDREIDAIVSFAGTASVYRRIKDKRMGDPVGLGVADRGNILTVADFNGRKLLSFRFGPISSRDGRKVFGPGPKGNDPYEYAGSLSVSGRPFQVNSANVN